MNYKNTIVKIEKLIEKFEGKQPEIVFAWKDSETEAEGWVVINSLRGGAAGGGTRMRKGLDQLVQSGTSDIKALLRYRR